MKLNEKIALVQLQRLHNEIASARPGIGTRCLNLFVSGLSGFLALLLTAVGLQSLHVGQDWSVPTGLLVFASAWVGLAVLLQRDAIRKANRKEVTLRQQVTASIQEVASVSSEWVASVGGPDALSDGQRFRELLIALRSMPGQGSTQAPTIALPVAPLGVSAVSVADPLSADTGAMKLRTCARGFLVGGILNLIVGVIAVFVVGPLCVLPLALGSIELVYASLFWSTPPSARHDPTWVATIELLGLIIGSGWSFIIGLANLRRLKAVDTKSYLNSLRTGLL
jgi:hypothetical protein